MALYLGNEKMKINFNGERYKNQFYTSLSMLPNNILLSSDGYYLKSSDGKYLLAKEGE